MAPTAKAPRLHFHALRRTGTPQGPPCPAPCGRRYEPQRRGRRTPHWTAPRWAGGGAAELPQVALAQGERVCSTTFLHQQAGLGWRWPACPPLASRRLVGAVAGQARRKLYRLELPNFRTSEASKTCPLPSPPTHDDHGTPGASARFNSWTLRGAAKWAKPRLHLDHKATRSLSTPQPSLALHQHCGTATRCRRRSLTFTLATSHVSC